MKLLHVLSLFLAIAVIGVLMSFRPQADALPDDLKPKYIRHNVHSPEGKANLKIMEEGLTKMKEMDCSEPFSWYFQGGLHGAPETGTNDFCKSFFLDGAKGWNNCTHHTEQDFSTQLDARLHFLSWHKLYLDHFEDAIRKVTGKSEFSMPYWEYDAKDEQNRTMPAQLQNAKSSLYASCRRAHVNAGKPIPPIAVISPDGERKMDVTNPEKAFKAVSFIRFTKHLESVPHNMMHNYLGTDVEASCKVNSITADPDTDDEGYYNGWMADNTSAAMDPVFWIHHANIDRLFTKWLVEKVDDELAVRPSFRDFNSYPWGYRFYLENDLSSLKVYTAEEAYRGAYGVTDYAYADLIKNEDAYKKYRRKTKKAVNAQIAQTADLFIPVDLTVAQSDVDKKIGGRGNDSDFDFSITQDFSALKIRREVVRGWALEIDVSFEEEPNGVFNVYVKQGTASRKRAGTMTFFGSGHDHSEHSSNKTGSGEEEQASEIQFDFDISELVSLPGDVTVIIGESNYDDEDANLTIDRIRIYREIIIKDRN